MQPRKGGGALSFKGSSKSLPKLKKTEHNGATEQAAWKANEAPPPFWTFAEKFCDLQGPLFILFVDRSGKISRFRFLENGQVERLAVRLAHRGDDPVSPESDVTGMEPTDMEDVVLGQWIGNIRDDQPTAPGIFGIKTTHGRYMSSDPIGKVYYEREAIGAAEEWIPEFILTADMPQGTKKSQINDFPMLAFRSKHGKYLSYDDTLKAFRADSDKIASAETFIVKVQHEKREAQRRARLQSSTSADDLELSVSQLSQYEQSQLRKYQSYGEILSKNDASDLSEAKRQGSIHEALLERRVKAKSDKFCR